MYDITPSEQENNPLQESEGMRGLAIHADDAARRFVFEDHFIKLSESTRRAYCSAAQSFQAFLAENDYHVEDLATDPEAWRGLSFGLVEAFKVWMLNRGDAISTVIAYLSHIKSYAGLANRAVEKIRAYGRFCNLAGGLSFGNCQLGDRSFFRNPHSPAARRGSLRPEPFHPRLKAPIESARRRAFPPADRSPGGRDGRADLSRDEPEQLGGHGPGLGGTARVDPRGHGGDERVAGGTGRPATRSDGP